MHYQSKGAGVLLIVLAAVLLAVAAAAIANAQNARGTRMLVVVDSEKKQRESHSQFFAMLEKRGYSLTFKEAKSDLALKLYGDYLYDHIMILAPESDLASLRAGAILDFIDTTDANGLGHNVLIAAGSSTSEPGESTRLSDTLREVASECGVEFAEDDTFSIDHFHYDANLDPEKHTVLALSNLIKGVPSVYSPPSSDAMVPPVLYRGMAMDLDSDNLLLMPILSGYPTTYSFSANFEEDGPVSRDPHVAGKDTVLVAGLQTRNGPRVAFLGSLEMLSDRAFAGRVNDTNFPAGKPGQFASSLNKHFASELTKWVFQERGMLRYRDITYYKANGTEKNPSMFRINDDVKYTVIIEESRDGKWVPYVANDFQLEFIMLDPYIRTSLKHVGSGKYEASFTAPDVYGVYQFKVDYRRQGHNLLTFSTQIPVRPLRLNEFERFIDAAYPYYVSAFSMLVGFFVFGMVYLYHKD